MSLESLQEACKAAEFTRRVKKVVAFHFDPTETILADELNKWIEGNPTCEVCNVECLTIGSSMRNDDQAVCLLYYYDLVKY